MKKALRTKALIEKYISKQKNTHFVDVYSAMLTSDGKPRPDIFIKDNLHMNEAGTGYG